MSAPDIASRMSEIIRTHTDPKRRAKELEEKTGVPATNWKNFLSGKQRPTSQMIETVAKAWPQYALWLACGATDEALGHSAPQSAWGIHPGGRAQPKELQTTENYLNLTLYLHFLIYGESTAFQNNLTPKKDPTAEDVDHTLSDSMAKVELEQADSGKTKIFKQKYRDLDEAINQLARDRWIQLQEERFGLVGMSWEEQVEHLTALRKELTQQRSCRCVKENGNVGSD